MSRARRRLVRLVASAAAIALAPRASGAQIAPDAHWRTIATTHFRIHFTPPLEAAARRAAVDAERAYASLADRLHPPRQPIHLVVADNVDFSNGLTTPFPVNRIIVYAHPPLDVVSLRFYDDWLQLVITHELTHVFHLDRTGGWWRVAQHVFGRAPFLFPNQYEPAWIIEGLAVYQESAITGAGRVEGSYERMLVHANVLDGPLLPYDRWNLVSTRFPGGDVPYGYGALFFDFLAHAHGDAAVRAFVERTSGKTIPFFLNGAARDAFGATFDDAFARWRDSVIATRPAPAMPMPGWRDLTHAGFTAAFPRWVGDTALVYARADWIANPAAMRVDTAGHETRLGRRNGSDENAPLAGGGLVFSQLEYVDPYRIREDLYRQRRSGVERLTHGARLAEVDARSDGALVAVRFLPVAVQLVRVSADGRTITPLTGTSPDTTYAEPRWSPRGDRIAATQWTRGGYADVVVLDTLGRVLHRLTHDRAFDASPSWTPDGRHIVFSSDRTGVTELYIADADGRAPPRRFTRSPVGVYYPAVSPDGRTIAAVRYDERGYHVGIAPFDTAGADTPPVAAQYEAEPMAPVTTDSARARDYSAWSTVLPRFWLPIAGQTTRGSLTFGAFTTGGDVIGRHSYFLEAEADPTGPEHTFTARYQFAGLGVPLLGVGAQQDWDRQYVADTNGTKAGDLLRRRQTYSVSLTFDRPRVRSNAFLILSGELELRHYLTEPAPLIGRLIDYYRSNPRYYAAVASLGWSNAQYPPRAVSYEDGIAFAATGRLRWLEGTSALEERSVSALFNAYKSIGTGSFAHDVLAARVAAGVASGADPGVYDIGGSNGTPVAVFPGFIVGSQHTFAVRGFPSGIRSGERVLTGSLEYRMPLAAPHRGLGFWPVFLDRTSLSVFTDAGTTWSGMGTAPLDGKPIASAGAEVSANLGLQYDVPYVVRLGVAFPYVQHVVERAAPASVYFQIGLAF